MKKNVLNSMWKWIKGTTLYKACERFYGGIIHILFMSKWVSKVLAYGGLHLLLLILLGCQAAYMWKDLNKNNVTSFNQIIYHFYGDTLHNYRLNYLKFEKDMRRRPDNTYNLNDIKFDYGFVKIDSIETVKTPIKYKDFQGEGVLVSKIRYLTCNDIPDTISSRTRQDFLKDSTLIYNGEYLSNHERYYYDVATLDNKSFIFSRKTNALDHLIEWDKIKPCFSFWIGIITDSLTELNDKSIIRIKFNDFEKDVNSKGYRSPLIVEKVSPQPTTQNLKEIVFEGKELKDVIEQRGIFVSGVDPEKKIIIEKKNFRATVLLGVIIAFMLDILVQLVLKWRKLQEYKRRDKNN